MRPNSTNSTVFGSRQFGSILKQEDGAKSNLSVVVFQYGDANIVNRVGYWIHTVQQFAAERGFKYRCFADPVMRIPGCEHGCGGKNWARAKPYLIQHELNSLPLGSGSWLIFLDTDLMIANPNRHRELEDLMQAKKCKFIAQETRDTINTGFLAFRASPEARRLVSLWIEEYERIKPLGSWLHDQGALQSAMLKTAREYAIRHGSRVKPHNATCDVSRSIGAHDRDVCWNKFMVELGLGPDKRSFGSYCLLGHEYRWNMHDSGEKYEDGDFFCHQALWQKCPNWFSKTKAVC